MTPKERENLVNTLNLEYGATYRYDLQVRRFPYAKAVSLLEGVRRNEAEHIGIAMKAIEEDVTGAPEGFKSLWLHLKLNLDFEKLAVKIYSQSANEAETEEVRETFRDLLKSEAGHVRLFTQMIKDIEEGVFPKIFFCPLCGWEMDYGADAEAGAVQKCVKCGAKYELVIENGDYLLQKARV